MEHWYELWNMETGNMVATFDTWPQALEQLKRDAAAYPASRFDSLALLKDHANFEEPQIVAEGRGILDAVNSSKSLVHID
jgi:hypothetical protein